ncbi:MAG: amidinotransferase [Caldilineaceae bacterium]|nr:amidinotransferase [Caldilineaceae bacterium]
MNPEVGCQSMVDPIRLCLVKHPSASHVDQATIDEQWQALHYPARPRFDNVLAEYERFVDLLGRHGVELLQLPRHATVGLDSIYTHDPVVVTGQGVILGNMGKPQRLAEPAVAAEFLRHIGMPILGEIGGDGRLEGGDVCWLDARTVAVGMGYRTNAEGIRQLRTLLNGLVDEVIPVPLPHWTGPDDCLHLLSIISPVDHRKAVVYSRMMPVPFRDLLLARGFTLIEVPDKEYDSMACNVLAIGPGQCIMLDGNPVTRGRLEDAGVEVAVFSGQDLCIKGGGGPTCLTRPLLRR